MNLAKNTGKVSRIWTPFNATAARGRLRRLARGPVTSVAENSAKAVLAVFHTSHPLSAGARAKFNIQGWRETPLRFERGEPVTLAKAGGRAAVRDFSGVLVRRGCRGQERGDTKTRPECGHSKHREHQSGSGNRGRRSRPTVAPRLHLLHWPHVRRTSVPI